MIEWKIQRTRRGRLLHLWRLTCGCGDYDGPWVPTWQGQLTKLAAIERSKRADDEWRQHRMEAHNAQYNSTANATSRRGG